MSTSPSGSKHPPFECKKTASNTDIQESTDEPRQPSLRTSMPQIRPRTVSQSNVGALSEVSDDKTILFAVPKKGRLHQEVMNLLQGAGLDAKRPDRLDVAMCKELPVKLVFLPASDIPMYVMDAHVDIGVTGSDVLEEALVDAGMGMGENDAKPPLKKLMDLGFGKCKLCLQAPVERIAEGPHAFAGARVVTSFPALTKKYFDGLGGEGPKTSIKVVSGSVEAAVGLGLADAIVDLVETGTTMRAAGLDVVSEIHSSEAIIIQQLPNEENGLDGPKGDLISLIMQRINGFIVSTKFVMVSYNVSEENLAACCAITPGRRSPTVTPLSESGWRAVSALVEKKQIHTKMDQLQDAGATDILVTSLTNTRMIDRKSVV